MAVSRDVATTRVLEWQDGQTQRLTDCLAAEEPLEIRIAGNPVSVTMRTPGSDSELAAGFLFTEGIIRDAHEIGDIRPESGPRQNIINVELVGSRFDPELLRRNFFANSSCGICGKASIEAVRLRGIRAPNPRFRFSAESLCGLPDKLRATQTAFGRTGGLHAAALFNADSALICVREDVGRHNAVDKVIGWALLNGRLPLAESVLMVSGRGGFEIVQKALAAGVPLIACVSAPSSLAVELARELGGTLVGFLRGRRFVVYSGEQRLY